MNEQQSQTLKSVYLIKNRRNNLLFSYTFNLDFVVLSLIYFLIASILKDLNLNKHFERLRKRLIVCPAT